MSNTITEVRVKISDAAFQIQWGLVSEKGRFLWTYKDMEVRFYCDPFPNFKEAKLLNSPLESISTTSTETFSLQLPFFNFGIGYEKARPSFQSGNPTADPSGRYLPLFLQLADLKLTHGGIITYVPIEIPFDIEKEVKYFQWSLVFGYSNRGQFIEVHKETGNSLYLPTQYKDIETAVRQNNLAFLNQQPKFAIERSELLREFLEFVSKGSGLVIGKPGVGKSYTLRALVSNLLENNISVVAFSVDGLDYADTYGAFEKKFGCTINQFISYLVYLCLDQDQESILVIDAFDAARSPQKREFLLDLIKQLSANLTEWNIVVSVRTFDAQHSNDLQQLFPSKDQDKLSMIFQNQEITSRHFIIPELAQSEVQGFLAENNLPLQSAFDIESDDWQFLCLPFNLSLLFELKNSGVSSKEISSIKSQNDLLERYWAKRVGIHEGLRQSLNRIVAKMLEVPRLSIPRDEAYKLVVPDTWDILFSSEVLCFSDSEETLVSFTHNIFFDYAVSLLIIGTQTSFIDFLAEDTSLTLFLLPSLDYYLTRLWHRDNGLFWKQYWNIFGKTEVIHLNLLRKTLFNVIVTREVQDFRQLEPLVNRLKDNDPQVINSISNALQAFKAGEGHHDTRWVEFLLELSLHITPQVAWIMAQVTLDIIERSIQSQTREIFENCGIISRRLLDWVWQARDAEINPWFDQFAGRQAIPLVAKTFQTNSSESRILLEYILNLMDEEGFPIDLVWWLTNNLHYIWNYDGEFASRVYIEVFKHNEKSTEPTTMGGIVLPLISNRRQDYDHCKYILTGRFESFLQQQPDWAMRAAIESSNYFLIHNSYLLSEVEAETDIKEFKFLGGIGHIISGYRFAYARRGVEGDPEIMLDLIGEKIRAATSIEQINLLLSLFRDFAIIPYLWRWLIKISLSNPESYQSFFFDLCIATPILESCTQEIAQYINAIDHSLSDEQLLQIETAITLIQDEWRKQALVRQLLPNSRFKTTAIMDLIGQIEEYDREQGDELQSEEVGFELTDIVFPHAADKNTKSLTPEADLLTKLQVSNEKMSQENVSPDVSGEAANLLDEALVVIQPENDLGEDFVRSIYINATYLARQLCHPKHELSDRQVTICRHILLEGSTSSELERSQEFSGQILFSPGTPREEAAWGLPFLAIRKIDDEITSAIIRLSKDDAAGVRIRLVRNLGVLFDSEAEDLFWQIIMERAEFENHPDVQYVICQILGHTRRHNNCIPTLEKLIENIIRTNQDAEAMKAIGEVICLLVLNENMDWASEQINRFFAEPIVFATAIQGLSWRFLMKLRDATPEDRSSSELSQQSISYLGQCIDAIKLGTVRLIENGANPRNWDENTVTKFKILNRTLDQIATHLYFACDIWDPIEAKSQEKKLTDSERKAFYFKIKPLLEKLATFALEEPNLAFSPDISHNIMKMFNGLVKYDPVSILHFAAEVTQASKPSGYQFDQLAIKELVQLVETILADFRHEIQGGQPLQDMLIILDIFAEAWWLEAYPLVWRLDEIFR